MARPRKEKQEVKVPDATRLDLSISNNLISINVVVSAVQPNTKE